MRTHVLLPVLGLLAAVQTTTLLAQSINERASKDDIVTVPDDDPAMVQAFRKARERLDEFLTLAQAPPRQLRGFSVKIGIPEGDRSEFFWIAPFAQNGDSFIGRINNEPRTVKRLRMGQTYEFTRQDIVDWTYIDVQTRKMYGNFSACALLTREPPEQAVEFRRQYGLDCEP